MCYNLCTICSCLIIFSLHKISLFSHIITKRVKKNFSFASTWTVLQSSLHSLFTYNSNQLFWAPYCRWQVFRLQKQPKQQVNQTKPESSPPYFLHNFPLYLVAFFCSFSSFAIIMQYAFPKTLFFFFLSDC